MQTNYKPPSRGRSAKQTCCTDAPCDSGLRNQYFEGKRLTADSFRVEQSYLLERRRLLNRAIHGWGVVYGYGLKPAPASGHRTQDNSGAIEIGAGLALDECGRELLLTRTDALDVEDLILLDAKGAQIERLPDDGNKSYNGKQGSEACWLLSVHYAEQGVGPVRVNDPCNCERKEWEHVCETVRFSLRRVDCAECCKPFECELTFGCGTGPCCKEHDEGPPRHQGGYGQTDSYQREDAERYETSHGPEPVTPHEIKPHEMPKNPVRRGGCQGLCDYLGTLSDLECGCLQEIEEPCGKVRVDLHHGVALACVRLRKGECDDWLFDRWIEPCGPRRLVKGNGVLFDLIRGCDLTRISAIGWAHWHRASEPIHWDDFRESFGAEDTAGSGRNLTKAYWVEFSRPVRKNTVRADCFSMTVIVSEDEAGWGEVRRVPILDVETVDAPGPQSGLVTRATLIVESAWVDDAVDSRKRIFNRREALIEIEIRGDYIVDCNGQTVDANAVGLSPSPTGNGTPGGTFLSTFRVLHPRDSRPRSSYDNLYRAQGV
jgi:hypothetical protein